MDRPKGWGAFARGSRARLGWYGAVMLCAFLAALSGCERQFADGSAVLAEGRPFPAIPLHLSSGKTVSIDSFRGKVVVLNVWATWCPPCRREMPALEELSRTLDPRHFAVVGLSTDKDALLAEGFLQENHITFINFLDQGGRIAKQLDLRVYPETFLIAPDGVLQKRVVGQQEWSSPAMIAFIQDIHRNHGHNDYALPNNKQP